MIKISFIMPFYNGAKTVIRALDSIYQISMPLNEFEIIIVDDYSPILAEVILSEYKKLHDNLRIFRHKKNTRQGGAKNTGISLADGQYIAFIDQDDMINPMNMVYAINTAIQKNVDIISCYYNIQDEFGQFLEVGVKYPNDSVITGKTFCEQYYDTKDSIGPWSYLYKKKYLLDLNRPMKEHVLLEDPDWTIWHLIHAKTITFVPLPIYVWIMNLSSITHLTNRYINRVDWIKAGLRKIEDAQKYSSISPIFSKKIIEDGKWNIDGSFRKLWKVNNYFMFYKYLGDILIKLQEMNWTGITKFYISYPKLSMIFLYLFGTPLKLVNYAKHKIVK